MPTEKHLHSIDTRRHIHEVQTRPEFLAALPRQNFRELPDAERHTHLRTAVSRGALAAAERAETEQGKNSLDVALFRLTSSIHDFEKSYTDLGEIRAAYKGISTRLMDEETRAEFKEAKQNVRKFNDALRGVIEIGGNRLSFDQLMNFLTTTYNTTHGESPSTFELHARETLVGMRNEVAFEQILIAAGIEFEEGTDEDDARGGDVKVVGVRIDTKASRHSAEKAKARARQGGYNPDKIVWSHINEEDFDGRLSLPFYKLQELAEKVRPDIERAVESVHPGRKIA